MNKQQFLAKHRHLNISEAELERKYRLLLEEYEQQRRLYESLSQLGERATLSGVGGSIPNPTPPAGSGWALNTGLSNYVQVSMDEDPLNGDVYTVSWNSILGASLLRKTDADGVIQWELPEIYTPDAGDIDTRPVRIRCAAAGSIAYVVYSQGVRAIDANGAEIWSYWNDGASASIYFIGAAENGAGTRLFVYGRNAGGDTPLYGVATFDAAAGTLLHENISFLDPAAGFDYAVADLIGTGSNTYLFPVAYGTTNTTLVQFEYGAPGAANVDWQANAVDTQLGGADAGSMAVSRSTDGLGGGGAPYFYLASPETLVKINSTGLIVWALSHDIPAVVGAATDADGNTYLLSNTLAGEIQVTCIDKTGALSYAYTIATATGGTLEAGGAPGSENSVAQARSSALLVIGRQDTPGFPGVWLETFLSLPLAAIAAGTYGLLYTVAAVDPATITLTTYTPAGGSQSLDSAVGTVVASTTATVSTPVFVPGSAVLTPLG